MNSVKFEKQSFTKRLSTMLKLDAKRVLISPLFYIFLGSCLVAPILILVMTTLLDGTVSVDPQTGVETVVEGFKNVWQIIATVPSADPSAMAMDMTAMCNINLVFFAVAVFVCLFVADEFRSGYAKNLFTGRASKSEYVISKTVVLSACGMLFVLAFFVGAMLGGAISKLPFSLEGVKIINVVFCMLSKLLLITVFIPLYLAVSVFAKQKSWLSLLCSLGAGALMFMMIPMITPLNATLLNPLLCLAGGLLFSIGVGFLSKYILEKTSLI